MAVVHVYHRPHPAAIAALFVSDKVGNNMYIRGLAVEAQAKRRITFAPRRVDTGLLRSNIHTSRIVKIIGYPRRGAQVGTWIKYGRWVHDGTGIWGPLHHRIYPRTKQYLKFTPKGSVKVVFARSTQGMRPNPFLKESLWAARL